MGDWTSVEHELPDAEGSDWILVYLSTGNIEMALYDDIDGFTDGDCYSFFGSVTHWQPLPEPPQ